MVLIIRSFSWYLEVRIIRIPPVYQNTYIKHTYQRMYPECLTVLNTTKAERNTQQNNKDNQGLFAATLSFMLTQSSRQHEDRVPTMPVYMPGEGGIKSCVRLWGLAQ